MKQTEAFIKNVFSKIANRYDFINTILSFGTNTGIVKRLSALILKEHRPKILLDLCCGTANISKELLGSMKDHHFPLPTVDCVDFCPEMLKEAQKKLFSEPTMIRYIRSDATTLPFSDNSYDTITLGYGIRNICQKQKALCEISRVLQPKGKLFILELTRPHKYVALPMRLYLQALLPIAGMALAGQWKAYRYLASSIYAFSTDQLLELLKKSGFKCTRVSTNSFGLLTFIEAEKL